MNQVIEGVSRCTSHRLSKQQQASITLVAGLGVDGDIHAGVTVQHLARVRKDPTKPNLRQVHLMHAELLDEFRSKGIRVSTGQLGENVLTRGLDLLALPTGTILRLGPEAVVEVTGLRNPCRQLDEVDDRVLGFVLSRDADGRVVRRSGIMSIVVAGGVVRPGQSIVVELPLGPFVPLQPV